MIVRLSLQVLLRSLATRNDRLQHNHLVVFDEWHQVHVIVTLDDEDPLTCGSPKGYPHVLGNISGASSRASKGTLETEQ
jgi:hypothetical protein